MSAFAPGLVRVAFLVALPFLGTSLLFAFTRGTPPSTSQTEAIQTVEDLLRLSERRAVAYFWHEADPRTGLVKDRASNVAPDSYTVSSIAATGFGLVALGIGVERGWLTREEAYERVRRTLRFFRDSMAQEHGWYPHFVNMETGERVWRSEFSSIDTALFLAGALFAGEVFPDSEVAQLADDLYRRVDFEWMRTDGGARPDARTLNHGWRPESGFLASRWDSYSELMLLYLLAIGSPTHPIPADTWEAWARPVGEYAGYRTFAVGPLFVHQFSHAFIDFRNRRDGLGWDYWTSSVNATLANRQFCIDQSDRFTTYGENSWGLSASDGPDGYRAYGAPPGRAEHDGTVAVLPMIASIVFTPTEVRAAMWDLYRTYGDRLWGRYGFSDSFNLDRDFWATDVIGIDLGAALLMIENERSGFVWRRFMRLESVRRAMKAVGFHPTTAAGP